MRECCLRQLFKPEVVLDVWTDASDQGGAVMIVDPKAVIRVRESWRWKNTLQQLAPPVVPIRRRELAAAVMDAVMARGLESRSHCK